MTTDKPEGAIIALEESQDMLFDHVADLHRIIDAVTGPSHARISDPGLILRASHDGSLVLDAEGELYRVVSGSWEPVSPSADVDPVIPVTIVHWAVPR